jgi:hypothetical protein
MADDWIFDVLRDLRSFAQINDLPAFAAQLERAARVAEAEIATRAEPHRAQVQSRSLN